MQTSNFKAFSMTNEEKRLKYRKTLKKLKREKEGSTWKHMEICDEKMLKLLETSKNETEQSKNLSIENTRNDWEVIWKDIKSVKSKDQCSIPTLIIPSPYFDFILSRALYGRKTVSSNRFRFTSFRSVCKS